ncbi:HEPN domain-containing protein [Brevundimonas aurantiaca]|jgi:hypothetical protein|uniref:HEPN domain-containing protein n=1 Tax=Brevundimonas TaxID=41275 RepID=UPI00174ADF22|nr:HEPN domain-containing protein [Brevundimonas aurantiaca]
MPSCTTNRVHYPQPILLDAREAGLLDRYLALKGKLGSRLDLALRRLRSAYGRVDEEDQLLDLSIAFEALLGDDKNELSFRYGLRGALLLGSGPEERRRIRTAIKTMYALRSKIVHGGTVTDDLRTVTRGAIAQVVLILQIFIGLGKEPDWNALELGEGLY